VTPVKYELGFYIPEDGILHIRSRGNIKTYMEGFNFTLLLHDEIELISDSACAKSKDLIFISYILDCG
jgi:hypothetical protein